MKTKWKQNLAHFTHFWAGNAKKGQTGKQEHTWEVETQRQLSPKQCEGVLFYTEATTELQQHKISYSINTLVASVDPCSDEDTYCRTRARCLYRSHRASFSSFQLTEHTRLLFKPSMDVSSKGRYKTHISQRGTCLYPRQIIQSAAPGLRM